MANDNKVTLTFLGDISNLEKKISTLRQGFEGIARTGTVAFAAISGSILVAVKAFSDFEKGLTNVYTLLSQDDLNQFGGQLENASKEAIKLGFGVQDTNKALFDNISALGVGEKSLKTFAIAQKLAIGGVTELSISVDGLTSIINAYGKEITDAEDVANAFFSAQKAGKTTVAELASNVGKIAPIAKQADIGFKTLLATMSQLTLGGLSTEIATTSLRSAIAGLIKPSAEAKKVLEEYNIPMGAAALQSADFTEVLQKLASAAKENPDALAEMITSQEALTAIGALSEKEIENLRQTIKNINEDIKNGTGLNEAYAKQMETFARQSAIVFGKIKVLAIEFGAIFAEALTPPLKFIGNIIEKIQEMPEPLKRIIAILTLVAGGISGVVAAVGLLGTALLILAGQAINAAKALATMGISLNKLQFLMRLNLVFIKQFTLTQLITGFLNWAKAIGTTIFSLQALKIALATVGIGILISAIGILYTAWEKNFGGIRDFTAKVFEFLKIIFNDSIRYWFELFKTFFIKIVKGFLDFADDVLTVTESIVNGVRKFFGKSETSIAKGIRNIASVWAEEWELAGERVKNAIPKDAKTKIIVDAETQVTGAEAPTDKSLFDDKEFQKREEKFLAHSQKIRGIKQQEIDDLKALDAAKTEEDLLKAAERFEQEREQRLLELEDKKLFWEQEGISEAEIRRQYAEEKATIDEEYNTRNEALKNRQKTFSVGFFNFFKKLRKDDLQDLSKAFGMSEQATRIAAVAEKTIARKAAVISTAKGAAKALEAGFPVGLINAAIIAARGAVEIGIIGSQSFAVGTDFVPKDMMAFLHEGEAIVPAKENQFLQSGKLALTAPNNITENTNNENSTVINNIFNVDGILIGDVDELAEKLHEKQSKAIAMNQLKPFPVGAQ